MDEGIVIVKDRITSVNVVSIKKLLAENARLRADVERIGRELALQRAANAELNARLTLCEASK